MDHVIIKTDIYTNSSSKRIWMPVLYIITDNTLKPLSSLVDYIKDRHFHKSSEWKEKLCLAIGLLADFISANPGYLDKPAKLYREFVAAFEFGTIDDKGNDPSLLYWLARSGGSASLLKRLDEWLNWICLKKDFPQLNPMVRANSYERYFNQIAYLNRTEKSVLGHLSSKKGAYEMAAAVRDIGFRRGPVSFTSSSGLAFPEDKFYDLLFKGFVLPGRDDELDYREKYDWQAICITLLMDSGGLRLSEPFHIWVSDIIEDPMFSGKALVRIYHPEFGAPPKGYGAKFRNTPTRESFLQLNYPGVIPRNRAKGNYFSGWKGGLLDPTTKHMQVYWFPSEDGQLFWKAWSIFIQQRVKAGIDCSLHPFAFVNLAGRYKGKPYTIDTFKSVHSRAVRRIGLIPSRENGTMNHSHRHAFGHRSNNAGIDRLTLKAMLHHIDIDSQETYRGMSVNAINSLLEEKSKLMNSDVFGRKSPIEINE